MQKVTRVRFAPSPTGNLHIGGARTALFNWLYARANKGEFILRIEDTDALRSKQEFVDEILESLRWLGFDWDQVSYQSKRFDLYRKYADNLLKEGLAYTEKFGDRVAPKAFSPDQAIPTAEPAGEAIIYKVSAQEIKVNDLIRGQISFDASTIKDQVLIKSDGTPTYNFACVVDDATTEITHVIRGDDHISNTPKQILLYQALRFKLPEFAHLPLIMGSGGGRLSKRTGATAISDYRSNGYLPEALLNYLLLLSWSPGGDREVIDLKEAVDLFEIKNVNKTSATFDLKKLDWMNNQYLKKAPADQLLKLVLPLLKEKKLVRDNNFDSKYLISLIKLFQERLSKVNDFAEWADFFFLDEIEIDPKAQKKFLSRDFSKEFELFIQRLEGLRSFQVSTIEETFRDLVKDLGIQAKELIHPVRVALTGKTVGPGLFDVVYYLGLEKTKIRLSKFIK